MEKKKHCKPLAISWYLLSIPAYIDASHSQVPSPLTDAVDARPNAAAVDRRVFGVTFGAIECPPGTAYCTGRGEIVTPLGRNRLFFFQELVLAFFPDTTQWDWHKLPISWGLGSGGQRTGNAWLCIGNFEKRTGAKYHFRGVSVVNHPVQLVTRLKHRS